MKNYLFASLLIFWFGCAFPAAAGEITATVPAVASIIENITGERPDTVINGSAVSCAHDYQLKPSDAVKITNAKLIFTVSRDFEPFFDAITKLKNEKAKIIELAKQKDIRLLNERKGEAWQHHHHHDEHDEEHPHDGDHDKEHHHHDESPETIDYHLWLDPDNALVIAETVTDAVSRLHPEKKDLYRRNLKEFAAKIKKLTESIDDMTKNKKRRLYMISHDSIQYLEKFFNLSGVGAVSDLESGEISIKKAIAVERAIKDNNVSLLLIVGNVYPKSLDRLKKENRLDIKNIDVIGTSLPPGKDLYFKMMTDIVDSVCSQPF